MKKPIFLKFHFFAILASVFYIGVSHTTYANPMQKTIIAGVITNFENPHDLPALELINYMPFISEWNTYSEFIEQDGTFHIVFEQLYPKGIMVRFKEMFSVYSYPGDSIYLTIDARLLSDTTKIRGYESNYIKINSPNQRFQDNYQDFTREFYSSFGTYDDFTELRDAQKNLDHSAYSEYLKNRSTIYNTFLNEFVKENKPNFEFQEWAENWLYLMEMDDLLRYTWLHPMYNELDRNTFRLPDEYYDFLKDKRHNNEELMSSHRYRSFLQELYMHIDMEFHQSEFFSKFDTLYKAGAKIEAYRMIIKFIIDNSNGFEQEFFVSKFFSQLVFWKFLDEYDALYDPSLIGRDDYNQILENEYNNLQELIAKPVYAKDLKMHESGLSKDDWVFQALPKKFPNKVIYVDFWAPWCGPCMAEMPHSKELQERMKGKDITFVFLAGRCTEKSWKATISQKQLSGEHFLIDDKEYSKLADTFNIAGIPRYMIIDKQGKVVNDNAPRPSDENLTGLLETLSSK